MEEKILEKLDRMDHKIDAMQIKMDTMNQKFEKKFEEVDERFDELKNELRAEFKQENARLEEKLRTELKQETAKLQENITNRIKKEVLDQMFVFENDYGRKINIMYEELTARNERTEGLEKNLMALQRRVDKNSAFIFSYENQNATLEKAKNN